MRSSNMHMLALLELGELTSDDGTPAERYREVAQDAFKERLKDWIRPKDQCHTLPDQRMCVVLAGVSSTGELELAKNKLNRVFARPHDYLGKQIPLNVIAGFAPYSEEAQDMSAAVQNAAKALEKAKNEFSASELYSPVSANDDRIQAKLLDRMEEALERGEFKVYLQPKVHAAYRNMVSAEALIRWHAGGGQIIKPQDFMDLAEGDAIIRPLTWWVIKSAAARLAKWPESTGIAVNVSPELLLNDEIISVILDALDIYAVAPERLTLEVTEQILVKDPDRVVATLAALRSHGIRISIDDFGTGYSSLAYIRDLPADEIKIDRRFVQHMLTSEKDEAIVEAVIKLAHSFSLKVVAEGVESDAVADRLTAMHCDYLQGYTFDEPLCIDEFETSYKLR